MSVEEDDAMSSHDSINSAVSPDGKPNIIKILKSAERRKSLRIEEKDLGLDDDDDKSYSLSTT